MIKKIFATAAILTFSPMLGAAVAFADNVHAVYAVANTDTIEVGQTTVVNYRIGATGSDGCDASDGTGVTVTVNVPAGVTADDNSLDFSFCSSGNVTNAQSVTFTGTVAGDYTFGVSVSGDPTDTYNTNSANITLHVTAAPVVPTDVTAPPVPTLVTPDNTYTTTANQASLDWDDVVDAVSNPVTYDYQASNSPTTDGTTGDFTVEPVYNVPGLTTSEVLTPGTPEGVYYWHVRAKDSLGNTSAWSETRKITVDNQAPTVVCDPAVADGNWHQNDVSFPCTSTDNGPGALADEADASFSLSTDVAADTEDADASTVAHADVCDLSGNCTPVTAITGNMIDKKGPTITATQDLVYTYNQAVTPVYSCTDAGSGMVGGSSSCTNTAVDTSSITLISRTFTISAMDMVGNASTLPVSFTVLGYENFTLGNPLSMSLKDFKKASTIPVKFMIQNHDLSYVNNASAHLTVNGQPAKPSGSSNTGTLFRYDAAAHQYIYNLSTKSLQVGLNELVIDLGDGSAPVHKTFTIK